MNIHNFISNHYDASIPWVNNFYQKNKTLLWSPSDAEETFLKNLQNKENRRRLERLGWDTATITYSYNSNGFRDEEFDDRPCGIALGDSFTEGIGLPAQSIWPSLLSEHTGTHVWNLGVGGGSIDTVFRLFDYYVLALKPQFVCVLMPICMRFEYKSHDNRFSIITSQDLGVGPAFSKDWLSQQYNGMKNQKKAMLAMQYLCQHYNIPLIFNKCEDGMSASIIADDFARDLIHVGTEYQLRQAEYMFNQLTTLK
jgi:hypothetical protein